ncbi:MAG: DUF1501 domain-containing protein [Planctomycetota bacterium]|nr:DUF1501 domain-containing protein [Planctomycetota bacterium]MDA1213606.1 DUF1501 domain-containing protein [Planctomycetota bacterium]
MLSINSTNRITCEKIQRRQLLQVGGAGLLGLTLPKLLQAEAVSAPNFGRAKSVIFLFLFGGPSQLETFDMKPEAPDRIRGPFKPIDCRTPGLMISEHLPHLADLSDKYCVFRSMTHTFNDHSGGGHYIQTGKIWHVPIGGGFNPTPKDWPSIGSVVEYQTQHTPGGLERDLPSYVVLPNSLGRLQEAGMYRRPGEHSGWLGQSYNPLTTQVDKRDLKDNPYWRDCTDEELTFDIEGLASDATLQLDRIVRRKSLLEQFDDQRSLADASKQEFVYDRFQQRALALVSSEKTRSTLDIRREPDALRDKYGRHLFGQSCLMARRFIEAGSRFVTVHYDCVDGYSWDSHRNSDDVKNHLLPTFDQGAAALISDLEERGLLDETLVIAIGEMGRTPQANGNWGRSHWSTLFPAVLAGGGVRGGTMYGGSDKDAAYPVDNPTTPEDLAATIYNALGVDPELRVPDAQGRPVQLIEEGHPVTAIFG